MSAQDYDSIIEKAKKIKRLADEGFAGEADAARAKLNLILQKYNISLADIEQDQTREYRIKLKCKDDSHIYYQLLYFVTNGAGMTKCGSFKRAPNLYWCEITPIQFVELSEMLAFHLKLYRKELSAMKSRFFSAYASKHGLFPEGHKNKSELDPDEAIKVISVMNSLSDDEKYHKALKNGKSYKN